MNFKYYTKIMMKHLITVITLLFISFSWVDAQDVKQQVTTEDSIKTVVHGFIPEHIDTTLSVRLTLVDFEKNTNLFSRNKTYLTSTENGFFKFDLSLQEISVIVIDILGRPRLRNPTGYGVYIEPGDSLFMEFQDLKSQNIQDVLFTGTGATKMLLLQDFLNQYSDHKVNVNHNLSRRIDRAVFCMELASDLLQDYKDSLSNIAYKSLQLSLNLRFYDNVNRVFLKKYDSNILNLYEQEFKKNLPITTEMLKVDNIYGSGAKRYLVLYERALLDYLVSNKLSYEERPKNKKEIYNILYQAYKNNPIKSWVLAKYIIKKARHKGWDSELEEITQQFKNDISESSPYYKQIVSLEQTIKSNLSIEAKAHNFALQDTTGQIVRMGEFKGKVILLDFMYKGCVGCWYMAPKLDDLYQEYEGKGFEIVSISIDPNVSIFKEGIGEFSSSNGIHLYTNGQGSNHPIIKHYGIQAYPTLVLIGKNGKIIDGRAPDPRTEEGMKELKELIDKAL